MDDDEAVWGEFAQDLVGLCGTVAQARQQLNELKAEGLSLADLKTKYLSFPSAPLTAANPFVLPTNAEVAAELILGCGGYDQALAYLDDYSDQSELAATNGDEPVCGLAICCDCDSVLIGHQTEAHPLALPGVGSLRRVFERHVKHELQLYQQYELKQKRPGIRRPIPEQSAGGDLTRTSGRMSDKIRIIDRLNDRYYERVADAATGEVLHECSEPLSHHYGHGSARRQKYGFSHEQIAVEAY